MDDVQGDILGPPHGSTAVAVIANKIPEDQWSQYHSTEILSLMNDLWLWPCWPT